MYRSGVHVRHMSEPAPSSAQAALDVDIAVAIGCGAGLSDSPRPEDDIAAIRHLLMREQLQHAAAASVEIGALSAYERPLPTMTQYDQLLSGCSIEVQP